MGIPKFFTYLLHEYNERNECINTVDVMNTENMYDYLFLDYQSLCYSSLSVFSGEINYFIRLVNYIKYETTKELSKVDVPKVGVPKVGVPKVGVPEDDVPKKNYYEKNKYVLEYIINKYQRYFYVVGQTNTSPSISLVKPVGIFQFPLKNLTGNSMGVLVQLIEYMDRILSCDFKNERIVHDELVNQVFDLTIEMSQTQLNKEYNTKLYEKTFIFFDGIPTLAKVKEQLSRRVYPEVIGTIKSNLFIVPEIPNFFSTTITSKLLSSSAPIGIDTYIVNQLREILSSINDSDNGSFFINDRNKYGEAEHQIMKYLSDNIAQFQDKQILVASPDADLILLSLINVTKRITIDIIRVNGIDDKNYQFFKDKEMPNYKADMTGQIISPYRKTFDYINCNNIKSQLDLTSDQQILDVCYLLLLLGDDFVPIIPGFSVNDIPLIISTYKEFSADGDLIVNISGFKYILDHENLKKFIIQLNNKICNYNDKYTKIINKQNKKRRDNLKNVNNNYEKIFYLWLLDILSLEEQDKIKKMYYLENGYYIKPDESVIDLIKESRPIMPKYNPTVVSEYLKGCQFIFDIYLNNEVRNYKWYFRFNESPTLPHLVKFFNELGRRVNLSSHFDYFSSETPEKRAKYLNVESYLNFVNANKKHIVKDIISKMVPDEVLTDFERNYDDIKTRHFTLDKSEQIFNCNGKAYFNKCIEAEVLIDHSDHMTDIEVSMLGGKYYEKYLKYKEKYLKLKNSI
jgi:hypothetical protein